MDHLLEEYVALWEAHGVEGVAALKPRLLARLSPQIPAPQKAPSPRLLFVGEALGKKDEANQLLDRILSAMQLTSGSYALVENAKFRTVLEETTPELIVALGDTAASLVLGGGNYGAAMRGRFHPFPGRPCQVLLTLHPAQLLREPASKRVVWDDMKKVMARLETP